MRILDFLNALTQFRLQYRTSLKKFWQVQIMDEFWESREICYDIDPCSSASLGEISIQNNFTISELSRKNSHEWTPLMYACCKGWVKDVEYLLQRGVNVTGRDGSGRTCLILAIGSGDLTVVKLICTSDNIDDFDNRGWTALFYAVWFRRDACAEYLLSRGANPDVLDNSGESPRGLAEKSCIASLTQLFKKQAYVANRLPISYASSGSTPQRVRKPLSAKVMKGRKNKFSPNVLSPSHKENRPMSPHTPKQMYKIARLNTLDKAASPKTATPKNLAAKNLFFLKEVSEEVSFNVLTISDTKQYTTQSFLQLLNLEKYLPLFNKEEVDFETLLTFEEHNFTELGITLYGPRQKMLAAIREYKEMYGNTSFFDSK